MRTRDRAGTAGPQGRQVDCRRFPDRRGTPRLVRGPDARDHGHALGHHRPRRVRDLLGGRSPGWRAPRSRRGSTAFGWPFTARWSPRGRTIPKATCSNGSAPCPGAKDLPLFAVFDLHANFTPKMARYADGLVGYRENPHSDAFDAAALSAELLARSLDDRRAAAHRVADLSVLWPPTGTGTADRAHAHHERARAAHRKATIRTSGPSASSAATAFADTPDTGVAAVRRHDRATSPAPSAISIALGEIAVRERARGRAAANGTSMPPSTTRSPARIDGPAVLVEPADNIGGGAPGDCTAILRAMLARGLRTAPW